MSKSFLEFCAYLRSCYDAVFFSRYVTYLEADNSRLRVKIERLELAAAAKIKAAEPTPEVIKRVKDAPFAVHNGPRVWDDIKVSLHSREFPEPKPDEVKEN